MRMRVCDKWKGYNKLYKLGNKIYLTREVQLDNIFFLLMRGKWIQIPPKAGHHRPASGTPLKWRFAGERVMAQH